MHSEATSFEDNCFFKSITVSHSPLPLSKDYKTEKDGRITQYVTEEPNSCSRNQIWQQLIYNPMRENRKNAQRQM